MLEIFPNLKPRRHAKAGNLSGGEQQATAIGRALMTNPEVLLLDEVSLGLSPLVVDRVYASLQALIDSGTTIILVEQDLSRAMAVADRVLCMLEGRIVLERGKAEVVARGDHRRPISGCARVGHAGSRAAMINQLVQGVLLGGYYALIACGLSFMFSVMRIINLAHGSLAVLSAFGLWLLAERFGMQPFLGLAIVLPVMAAIGWVLQRYLLERSARGGALLPILTTFGLAIVIDNLLFEQFGADTRSLAPYIGSLSYDSWEWPGNIFVGKLAVIIFVVAVAAARRPAAVPELHRDGPGDPRHLRRPRHGRAGRHRCRARQCHRRGDRHGHGRSRRRLPRHARHLRPLFGHAAIAVRLRGGRHRRRRLAVGHADRRHRAGAGADARRATAPAGLPDRRPCRLRGRAVRPAGRHRPAARVACGAAHDRARGPRPAIERWTPASRAAVAGVAAAIAVLAVAPLFLGAGTVDRLTALFIYVILAAMWNALAGFGGLVSVGQQVFFGLGAYFTIRLADAGIDPFLSIFMAAIVVGALSLAAVAVHAAAEGRRVRDRHVGDLGADASAGQSRPADPGRDRHLADLAQRL